MVGKNSNTGGGFCINRRPLNSLPLGKAITGFVNYKTAEGLSDRSVDSYKRILEHWAEYAGNKHVAQFTDHDINAYLVYMRSEYTPNRWSGDTANLSPKTLRNIWITMCSFFRWANTEFQIESPMKNVPAPRFQKVEIEPFTREEVARMLKACTYSREADTSFRRQFVMRRTTANRDQAVILTLLDSCVRASEFCAFRVGDFDPKRGKLEIRHGIEGGAKGGKGRTVYLGKTARHTLRNTSMPVAVTCGRNLPGILDFSRPPAVYDVPCHGGAHADSSAASDLSDYTLRCLLVMARLTAAYTNEVASSCMMEDRACRNALWELEKRGYVEYHQNDTFIDSHLSSVRQRMSKGERQEEATWPYWRIRRPGLSSALRVWGVPSGAVFSYRSEKNRLLDSVHRRRSRQWPKWVSKALPHAEIYAGWSEVGILGLKANPDALAWGKILGNETLFWLEVESGHSSRNLILDKTTVRWLKATGYAEAVGVHLVFVFLAMPWVRDAARLAFIDVPKTSAVVVADWSRHNFGQLPFPKWGEVVVQ